MHGIALHFFCIPKAKNFMHLHSLACMRIFPNKKLIPPLAHNPQVDSSTPVSDSKQLLKDHGPVGTTLGCIKGRCSLDEKQVGPTRGGHDSFGKERG